MFTRPLNRPTPSLPASDMISHHIVAPLSSHWRKATCEEIGCLQFHNGWAIPLAGKDDGDLWQLQHCGRRYVEGELEGFGRAYFYEAGQPCFLASTHVKRIERPELFVVRDGDWRTALRDGNPRVFSGADAWADHYQTHVEQFQ